MTFSLLNPDAMASELTEILIQSPQNINYPMLHLSTPNLKDLLLEIRLIYLISKPEEKVLNLKLHKSSLFKEVIQISYSGLLML